MARRNTPAFVVACVLAAALGSVGHVVAEELSRPERDGIMRRAQVWMPPTTAVTDLSRNPGGDDGFAPDATVECRFQPSGVGGTTPKFDCRLADGDDVKVKYGRDNPEVFSETIATRLLASLGFPTDRMYTVARVRCLGCPDDPFKALQCLNDGTPIATCFPAVDYTRVTVFDDAVIERPVKGRRIETRDDSGWSWEELQVIDPAAGGASRTHVDALRLMAVYLGHWDNKAKNQRLVCLDDKEGGCERPLAMVQDLGDAFGPFKLDLDGWRRLPVWADQTSCRVSMRSLPYEGSTFPDTMISEEGRVFLAERLRGLSRADLRALLEGARLARYQPSKGRAASLDDWADAMYAKVRAIVDRAPCRPVTASSRPARR